MTAAPDSRPGEARLKAAIAELCAASNVEELLWHLTESAGDVGAFPHRCQTIDALAGNWDRLDPMDDRWQAIRGLLDLDQPTHSWRATTGVLECIIGMLNALVEIDADGREVRLARVQDFVAQIERLPVLWRALEDELASSEVRA
jgi:hypothetical protein